MPEALTLANERVEELMAVLETGAGLDVTVVVSASMLRDALRKDCLTLCASHSARCRLTPKLRCSLSVPRRELRPHLLA